MKIKRGPVICLFLTLGAASGAGVETVLAQSTSASGAFPSRAVRYVVPAAPGGGSDALARTLAQKLNEEWGQPVVVDNRSGANGIIGTDAVAKSKPDGYTWIQVLNTHVINPIVYRKIPYDARDLIPVTLLAKYPYILIVHPSLPAKSVRELIALAKARPGQLIYASSGNASGPHLSMELFKTRSKIDMVHVPYKGSGPGSIDLIGGHVQLLLTSYLSAVPLIRGGRVRVLAVTGARRAAALPDVSTMIESGVPGYDVNGWYGLMVAAGTPPAIVSKIQADVASALRAPAINARLVNELADPIGNSPEEFAAYLNSETQTWGGVIKNLNLPPESL